MLPSSTESPAIEHSRSKMFEKLYDSATPQLRYKVRMDAIVKMNNVVKPSLMNINNVILNGFNEKPLDF